MYEKLFNFLEQYVKLNKFEKALFKKFGKINKFKKNQIIHYSGDICNKLYFIESGLLRAYIINDKGQDFTWHIFFNDNYSKVSNLLVVDYESFLHNSKSKMTIEVLKESQLIEYDKKAIKFIWERTKSGCQLGRIFSQEAYATLHNYVISFATESAKERFEFFMSHSAHWFDLIPQHMIATHLGIRPESLSRLKREFKLSKSSKELLLNHSINL